MQILELEAVKSRSGSAIVSHRPASLPRQELSVLAHNQWRAFLRCRTRTTIAWQAIAGVWCWSRFRLFEAGQIFKQLRFATRACILSTNEGAIRSSNSFPNRSFG